MMTTDLDAVQPMFAAGDQIWVALAVLIIGAISSWLQNRNKPKEEQTPWSLEDEDQPPPVARQSAPPPIPQSAPGQPRPQELDWEQELKRLLGEEPAAPPPVPPPLPPKPVAARVVIKQTEDDEDEMEVQAARLAPMRESAAAYARGGERTARGGSMQESSAAHARAGSIQSLVTARMQRVDDRTEKHTPDFGLPTVHGPATRATRAVSAWRNPAAARQAIVASVILGPPKGMEN